MTLADEDASSILTDNANRAFQGNVAMQVTQPGGQLWNQAMQVTSPDDQLLNQFGRNQNIQIQMKYKSDFNKYRHRPPDPIGQSKAIWQFKWRHLVAKLVTNASS